MLTNQQINILAAVGFVIMWSSGFIGARLGTAEAGSLTVLMWRFIVAAAILSVWWLWKQRKRMSITIVLWQSFIGLLAQGGYLLGVFLSVENGVSAGTSNLITTLQPIVVAALAGPVLKQNTTIKEWIGLLIGILGVLLVVYDDLGTSAHVPIWAYALSVMAMVSLVTSTLLEKKFDFSAPLSDALPIQTIISALLFTVIALVSNQAAPPASYNFWVAVLWVAVLSSIGGYGFYWLNLTLGSVTRVSSLLYLTPPVTMIWAFLMFGETIGFFTIMGMLLCFIGVWIISQKEMRQWKVKRCIEM